MYWSLVSTDEVPWKIAHGAADQRCRYLSLCYALCSFDIYALLRFFPTQASLKVKLYFQRNPETPTENSESPQDIRETMT